MGLDIDLKGKKHPISGYRYCQRIPLSHKELKQVVRDAKLDRRYIELNEIGQIVMSPVSILHSLYSGKIGRIKGYEPVQKDCSYPSIRYNPYILIQKQRGNHYELAAGM